MSVNETTEHRREIRCACTKSKALVLLLEFQSIFLFAGWLLFYDVLLGERGGHEESKT